MNQPLKLLFGSLLVFAVALISYVLGMQRVIHSGSLVASPSQVIPSRTTPSPTNTAWEKFTSSLGYAISYPSLFHVRATKMSDTPASSSGVSILRAENDPTFISISVFDNSGNLAGKTLQEVTMGDFNSQITNHTTYVATLSVPKQIVFATLPAYSYTLLSKGSGGADSGWMENIARTWHTVEVSHNNRVYRFIYPEGTTFQKIIKTVSFR